jgi:hypothetical protein
MTIKDFNVKEVKVKREARIEAHLPRTTDLTLLTLKGHLLVEEMLDEIIRGYCLQPSCLDGVDIRFQVKARLARALVGDILPDSMWTMIDSLNSIRNDLAHKLESQKLNAKISAFNEIKYRESKSPKKSKKPSTTTDEVAEELAINIHYLLGQLTASETFVKAYLHLWNKALED